MIRINPSLLPLYSVFAVFLALNIALWSQNHTMKAAWGNVPPVSSEREAAMMAIGDRQMGYRMVSVMLQNLGNTGGDSTNLGKYDYKMLGQWFGLADRLDPDSSFVPYLAAFYFGSTPKTEDLTPIIDYLVDIGQRPGAQHWRWLAHATVLARYKQGNLQRAFEIANIMANLKEGNVPVWARSMPALILKAKGDKQAAYSIMMGILQDGVKHKTLSFYDIRLLRDNICKQILTPQQAVQDKLCASVK